MNKQTSKYIQVGLKEKEIPQIFSKMTMLHLISVSINVTFDKA